MAQTTLLVVVRCQRTDTSGHTPAFLHKIIKSYRKRSQEGGTICIMGETRNDIRRRPLGASSLRSPVKTMAPGSSRVVKAQTLAIEDMQGRICERKPNLRSGAETMLTLRDDQ